MSRTLFLFSIALAAFLALLVTAMNAGGVEVELAFVRFGAPLGLALVVAFTIGLLAGLAWRGYWVGELLSERGRLRREIRVLESQARSAAAGSQNS
jgi:uncharacterized integral membrane protein